MFNSSEIRGLCLRKCSIETLQNLPYFWKKKTHVVFFIFHFVLLYFFPNECPGLSTFEVGIIAQPHACKHFVIALFFNFFSTLYYSSKRKIWDLLTADFAWLCCSRFWFLDFGNNTIYECTVVFKFPDRFFWQKNQMLRSKNLIQLPYNHHHMIFCFCHFLVLV